VLTESELLLLASRVVSRFRRGLPFGVTVADARQEAVLHLLQQQTRYDPACGVNRDAWIVTKVTGIMRDLYGKAWRRQFKHPAVSDDGLPLPANEPSAVNVTLDVREALGLLTPIQRAVMELHLQEMTQREIALTLEITQPYVSQVLKAAREAIADLLGEAYDVPTG
jgi:RNA polymerase sigma factor (sigma-70 family)